MRHLIFAPEQSSYDIAILIKDSYFNKVNDNKLMANKENGNFRPTYYCFKDTQTSLLWVVPMSSKYKKYEKIFNNKVQKYGKCDTIKQFCNNTI